MFGLTIILAQVVGVLIIVLMAIGAQSKTQKSFLFFQVLINSLYILHYVLLSATTAVAVSIICVLRTLIFFLYQKAGKELPPWLLVSIYALVIGAGIVTWNNWTSIFPILATISYTYGQWQHNVITTKKTVILGDLCWIVYNLFCFAYADLIGKIVEVTSCSISLYRHKNEISHKS